MDLVLYPDPLLASAAAPVFQFGPSLLTLISKMTDAMYSADGVGLAAPQLGFLQRVVLVDPTAGMTSDGLIVLVNPQIVWSSDEKVISREGCLSLPGIVLNVERSAAVKVSYDDTDGNKKLRLFSKDVASIVQHELDHIDGLVMLDRVGPVARACAIRDYSKERQRSDNGEDFT